MKKKRIKPTSTLVRYLGIDMSRVSHNEKLISAGTGLLAMLCVFLISKQLIGGNSLNYYIMPPIGASIILLFATPHSALAQPWNLVLGHLIPATIGIICARYIPDIIIASALSIGLTLGAMYYARCIHPPGGGTALMTVFGGADVHDLGLYYLLTPVLLNIFLLLILAISINAFFSWRRYPAALTHRKKTSDSPVSSWRKKIEAKNIPHRPIEHADLVYALNQIGTFIDVSEEDLMRIYALATRNSTKKAPEF